MFSITNFDASERVKALNLAFFSFNYIFIGDINAKFGIPNFPHVDQMTSLDIGQNSDGEVLKTRFLVKSEIN